VVVEVEEDTGGIEDDDDGRGINPSGILFADDCDVEDCGKGAIADIFVEFAGIFILE
jgi:hypothetical protein